MSLHIYIQWIQLIHVNFVFTTRFSLRLFSSDQDNLIYCIKTDNFAISSFATSLLYLTSNLCHAVSEKEKFLMFDLFVQTWVIFTNKKCFMDLSLEPIWRSSGQNLPSKVFTWIFLQIFRRSRVVRRIFMLLRIPFLREKRKDSWTFSPKVKRFHRKWLQI